MPQDQFTIGSLAEGRSAVVEITPVAPFGTAGLPGTQIRGIGLGIESVATFPEVESYSDHEFYRNNFSPAEIAYCSVQPSPRASLCELWAVKQAVVKSGAAQAAPDRLASVEITCDETGKPSYPNCFVSVGHSETTVVAVCLWAIAPDPTSSRIPSALERGARPLSSFPPLQRLGIRVLMGFVALSLLFIFGAGFWFILNQIFH